MKYTKSDCAGTERGKWKIIHKFSNYNTEQTNQPTDKLNSIIVKAEEWLDMI